MAATMAAAAALNTPVPAWPKAVTALRMTMKIRAQIRPYSMAVAPDSSRRRRSRNRFIRASGPERSEKVAQIRDQRRVGGRHGVVRKPVRSHPRQGGVLASDHRPGPASAQIKWHQQVKAFVSMAGEHERRQAGLADLDAQLLAQFADQGRLGPFARIDLAAGKLP